MKTMINFLRHLFVFVFLCCFSLTVLAQNKVDVVKLKNGNILKGKIVRQVPGQFIELKTVDKNFWKFDMEDVAEIQYKQKRQSFKRFKIDTIENKNSGLYYELNFGVLTGNNSNQNNAPFSFLTHFTYLHKTGLAIGIGAGYEAFEEAQIPVFSEIKYHYKLKGIPSFLFFQAGYSFSIEDRDRQNYYYNYGEELDSKGGWMINPGIGFVLGKLSNSTLNLRVGYRYQKTKHDWINEYTDDIESLKEEFNRLSIHLGIIF